MTATLLRIASRGSPLALAQANLARRALARRLGWDETQLDALCPILAFRTMGDRILDRPLAEAGGKGLFVKEIEEVLLLGEADIAVHSAKDLPAFQPAGLALAAVLPREDPADVFIGRDCARFADLPMGATLGTSSVRRAAQALRARPDLKIAPMRGNVQTRLDKLARGEADGTLLAHAGLVRLAMRPERLEIFLPDDRLPALCQGAIALQVRGDDTTARDLAAHVDDPPSHIAIAAERGFLGALDGSCRTPIAGLARVADGTLAFDGEVLSLDGAQSWAASRRCTLTGAVEEAAATAYEAGREAAGDIRAAAGDQLPRL